MLSLQINKLRTSLVWSKKRGNMKNITLIAAIAMMTFTVILKASENPAGISSNLQSKHSSKRSYDRFKVPAGSYYVDITSQNPLQQIVLPSLDQNLTEAVHFSGTNMNGGVSLSSDGNSIIVPKKGLYKIEWNASLSLVQNAVIDYHFSLLKNGTTLLHPDPQVEGIIWSNFSDTVPSFSSAAASVIVPLCPNDEISLLLTIDGSEGLDQIVGVQIDSAQISAHFVSDFCN